MAVIYCFTSTGNSLYVAQKIALKIGAEVHPITAAATVSDDDVIGIVYPVFFWSAPKLVIDFAHSLTVQNPNAYIFAVATYGSAAPGVVGALRGFLQTGKISYSNTVKMVENYLPEYKVNDLESVHTKSEKKIAGIVNDIVNHDKRHGGSFTLINKMVYKTFPGNNPACDENFLISNQCTSCGLCAQVCPVDNITVAGGNPQFAHHCQHCIACMHVCPVSAINYGKSEGKARYIHPAIGVNGLTEFWKKGRID